MKTQIKWIDRDLNEIPIARMDDQYLYNTVKCVWNNTLGRNTPFGNVIQWTFKHPHTPTFLAEFFAEGIGELKDRNLAFAKDFLNHVDKNIFNTNIYEGDSHKVFIGMECGDL